MITSQFTRDLDAIELHNADFTRGSLNQDSYIRPNRLFTADEAIIVRSVGKISDTLMPHVVEKIIEIVSR
jgi:mRNA interferase MazF